MNEMKISQASDEIVSIFEKSKKIDNDTIIAICVVLGRFRTSAIEHGRQQLAKEIRQALPKERD